MKSYLSGKGDDDARHVVRNALVYPLSVETLMDGNGDGIGDFAGLMRRLDYLESLGVDVLWLCHPRFLDAVSSASSVHRDWYVWSDKRPKDLRSGIVFPGVQDSPWSYEKVRAWCFHRFYDFQPDLNMQSPRVRQEIQRIVRYRLQLSVAGVRVQWQRGDNVLLGEANACRVTTPSTSTMAEACT